MTDKVSMEPVGFGVLEYEVGNPSPDKHAWDFIAGWKEAAQEHINDAIQMQIDAGDVPMKYSAVPLYTAEQLSEARRLERERCAKVCDTHRVDDVLVGVGISKNCADMIRGLKDEV